MKWLKPRQQTNEPSGTGAGKPKKGFLRWLHWPRITLDLTKGSTRLKFFAGLAGLVLVSLGLLVGGIQGYDYTESISFCGTVCHSMYPQLERHQQSEHSKVACTQCHVGPGAAAFVQSKIDGSRQLVETVLNNYSRPIKSPVHNLRPARETCEGCHTPTSFKDNVIKIIKNYDDDKANTLIETTLILKMGGTNLLTGQSKGIHWHVSSEVYYIPLDDQRQIIGWIGVKMPDGTLKEYYSRDLIGMGQTAFVEKARAAGNLRKMDCIDCHNRAAHYIPYPEQAISQAISDNLISQSLPFIHKNGVEILNTKYASQEEAFQAIDALKDNYSSYPKEQVDQAVETIKKLYSMTNFPDMNLDWKSNPNNERHTPTAGCFRCHDGNHVLVDSAGIGDAISVKCNLCHTVPIVGRGNETIVEAPVIVGNVPASHSDFRWTIEHGNVVAGTDKQQCYNCHGQSFCNNAVCHNLSHPGDMAFTHPEEVKRVGVQVCYTCHQNVTCTRCHPSGFVKTK
jgi:hypothetical protein